MLKESKARGWSVSRNKTLVRRVSVTENKNPEKNQSRESLGSMCACKARLRTNHQPDITPGQSARHKCVVIEIRGWWNQPPFANIGIATGSISDLLVVDIDISLKKDGFASLKILEHQFGKLPHSLRVRTGSGGVHIYLQMPEHSVKCSVERLGKGLDVRADGGYVIAPPSVNISGKAYEWETPNE